MTAHAHIVRDFEELGTDMPDSERWFYSKTKAMTYARSLVRRYHTIEVQSLKKGGELESKWLTWTPAAYDGPLITARIDWTGPQRQTPGIIVHRCPIDCIVPTPEYDNEINEEHQYRVLATSTGGVIDNDNYFACVCGVWQDIEGTPEKVADMVTKYPYTHGDHTP